VLDRETTALDDWEERRRERSRRLHCRANASVSVDQSDALDHRPKRARRQRSPRARYFTNAGVVYLAHFGVAASMTASVPRHRRRAFLTAAKVLRLGGGARFENSPRCAACTSA
jgi:hypothetical protein